MEGTKLKADELVMKIRSEFESAISKTTWWPENEIMIQHYNNVMTYNSCWEA